MPKLVSSTFRLDKSAVREAVGDTVPLFRRAGMVAVRKAQSVTRADGLIDTGRMLAGFYAETTHVPGSDIETTVGNPVSYTVYQEYGTIYIQPHHMLGQGLQAATEYLDRNGVTGL